METMSGIFPELQAPFREGGSIDTDSMAKQAEHCIAAGAHGLVFPGMNGESGCLFEAERRTLVRVMTETAAGRVPVVAGVCGVSEAQAVAQAQHAGEVGADAILILPECCSQAGDPRVALGAVAEAAQMPLIMVHDWERTSLALAAELLHIIENIRYIQETVPEEDCRPEDHSVSAMIAAGGDACRGVFGSRMGHYMIPEMRRGVCGFMPGAFCPEIYRAIWDSFHNDTEEKARTLFADLRPMLTLMEDAGLLVCKEALVRRGVFATTVMRQSGLRELDPYYGHEFERAHARLEPYFAV